MPYACPCKEKKTCDSFSNESPYLYYLHSSEGYGDR